NRHARSARGRAGARRRARRAARGRAGAGKGRRVRAPGRAGALLVGGHLRAPRRDLRTAGGVKLKRPRLPQSPFVRLAIVVPALAGVGALLYWHGPDWNQVGNAFTSVV